MGYSFSQLEDLWRQAGGNPLSAGMAAAIAMAESGGNPSATHTNSNGTVDRGLWQINSIHGAQSTLDPLANARAAVAISGNGSSWRPWCTAWSNAACGGTYLGAGSPYQKFLTGSTYQGSAPSGDVTGANADLVGLPNPLSSVADGVVNKVESDIIKPMLKMALYALEGALGIVLLVMGIIMIYRATIGQTTTGRLAHRVARVGYRKARKSAPRRGRESRGESDTDDGGGDPAPEGH